MTPAQLATGEGAHYPMLTFAISNVQANYPENLNDVGFFAIPGDNAASNGVTVWMPSAVYIAKTSQHQAEAKKFVAYLSSVPGCDSLTKAGAATGPYLVKGCELLPTCRLAWPICCRTSRPKARRRRRSSSCRR